MKQLVEVKVLKYQEKSSVQLCRRVKSLYVQV